MQSVATLMQTVCMVTFVLYSICGISYFFVLLGAFRTKSCKKHMWKLLYILVSISPLQSCSVSHDYCSHILISGTVVYVLCISWTVFVLVVIASEQN
jgi:uncharacterized metal-binding protein